MITGPINSHTKRMLTITFRQLRYED